MTIMPLALLSELKSVQNVKTTEATAVSNLRMLLDRVSHGLQQYCQRRFDIYHEIKYFCSLPVLRGGDTNGVYLLTDRCDLLEVQSVINGDGSVVQTTALPRAAGMHHLYKLRSDNGIYWASGVLGPEDAIQVDGLWGYPGEWRLLSSLGAAVTNGTDITITVVSGTPFEIGMLIRIDSEYCLITDINTNILTVQRGYNGTTPTTHLINAAVHRFVPDLLVTATTLRLAQWRIKQAESPLFNTVVLSDFQLTTTINKLPEDLQGDIRVLRKTPMIGRS